MKKSAILIVFVLLMLAGVNASANHIPILLYHDVQQSYTEDKAVITVTPEKFDEHIYTLLINGYTPVSFEDVYNAANGKFTMPERPVIISFDDGYDTNYKYAYPVIMKYGVKATIFVVTDTVGKTLKNSVHFDWNHAKEMQDSGLVSIYSHTLNHSDLMELDGFELERELRMSRYQIEKNLGTSCDVIAFPYGNFNSTVTEAARRAGYNVMAQVGETGVNTLYNVKNSPLVRITVYGSWSGQDLIDMINSNANQ